MYKNVVSQKIAVAAWDGANSEWKTGDAANITAQISKDGGTCAATNDVHPTELDATNAKGIYIFDMTQTETNGDMLVLSPVSSTADITLKPIIIYTQELALFKATGFSVPNEYDATLSVIAVDVAGLDGEAMRGTDNAPTASDIVTGILNGVIEGTLTVKEATRVLLAPIAGKSDGAKTVTQHFRNTTDTKNVVTATVDMDGNRTGITLDVSD